MILEPCAARAAGVAHNPPLDRQASWHQCLTECQRVDDRVSMECAKREPSEKKKMRRIRHEPYAAQLVARVNDPPVTIHLLIFELSTICSYLFCWLLLCAWHCKRTRLDMLSFELEMAR